MLVTQAYLRALDPCLVFDMVEADSRLHPQTVLRLSCEYPQTVSSFGSPRIDLQLDLEYAWIGLQPAYEHPAGVPLSGSETPWLVLRSDFPYEGLVADTSNPPDWYPHSHHRYQGTSATRPEFVDGTVNGKHH